MKKFEYNMKKFESESAASLDMTKMNCEGWEVAFVNYIPEAFGYTILRANEAYLVTYKKEIN